MKDQLFIPKDIKVGYNERSDTYTGKLAYVICYDTKGKLRKEASWNGWIDKGEFKWEGKHPNQKQVQTRPPLDTHDFDNVPTSGFVLNKKAGGTGGGWEHRQMKCRVYDPRGFEFEIAIDNLLFILQESNSYKGKGLEGEFVYAWEGKDLVLLPTESEDYKQSQGFTKLQSQKVKAKEMVPGYVYETKRQEILTYLGKLDWYDMTPIKDKSKSRWNYDHQTNHSKQFVFVNEDKELEIMSSIANIAQCTNDTVSPDFAYLMDIYTNSIHSSKPTGLIQKDVTLDFKEGDESYYYSIEQHICRELSTDKYVLYEIYPTKEYVYAKNPDGSNNYSLASEYKLTHYRLAARNLVTYKDGVIVKCTDYSQLTDYNFKEKILNPRYSLAHSAYSWIDQYQEVEKRFQKEDILSLNYKELCVSLENGKEIPFNKYS